MIPVNEQLKTALLWGLVIAAIFFFVMHFGKSPERAQSITFSEFIRDVRSHDVTSVTLQQNKVTGQLSSGTRFATYNPETNNTSLLARLERDHVRILAKPPAEPSFFMSLLENVLPFVLLIGLWWWLM
ncbi:ATP-dependent metalloprotease FtsH, partial [mine drainage metagenome]